jgi:hypothetical protein
MPRVTDKNEIRTRLRRDPGWSAYALADLAPPMFPKTLWFMPDLTLVVQDYGTAILFAMGPGSVREALECVQDLQAASTRRFESHGCAGTGASGGDDNSETGGRYRPTAPAVRGDHEEGHAVFEERERRQFVLLAARRVTTDRSTSPQSNVRRPRPRSIRLREAEAWASRASLESAVRLEPFHFLNERSLGDATDFIGHPLSPKKTLHPITRHLESAKGPQSDLVLCSVWDSSEEQDEMLPIRERQQLLVASYHFHSVDTGLTAKHANDNWRLTWAIRSRHLPGDDGLRKNRVVRV